MHRRRRMSTPLLLLSLAALLLGCAAGRSDAEGEPITAQTALVVFVASSLSAPFEELATRFERERPDVDIQLSAASSSVLAAQVDDGAPAGVFASAGAGPVEQAGDRVVDPVVFATDDLVLAVPAGNPGRISRTADLRRPELRVGTCAAGVPCGDYARRLLNEAGVVASVDTDEPDAASLLAKVRSGDLDAAILYRSLVAAVAPMVEAVEVDPPSAVLVEYLISALRTPDGSPPSADASEFVEFVLGPGEAVLNSAGLGTP